MPEFTIPDHMSRLATQAREALVNRRLDRRALIAGGAVAGATVLGVAGATMLNEETPPPDSSSDTGVPSPTASTGGSPGAEQNAADALPVGMVLVTSPRLPLWGVSADQAAMLTRNGARDWSEVGAPITLPVRPVALNEMVPDGMEPAETFTDYEALVAGLDSERGGVALIPIEQVDFRVNTLSIDGVDPLVTAEGNETTFRVAIAGDMIPGRNVAAHIRRYGDYTFPYHKVSQFLKSFDLTVGNLEIILSDTIPPPEESNPFTLDFVCDPAVIEGLIQSGFDAVSLANNHTVYNQAYGIDAFLGTIGFLDDAEIPYFGAGLDLDAARAAYITEIGGTSIAFIGIDGVTANPLHQDDGEAVVPVDVSATADAAGTNPFNPDYFVADIRALAAEHDIVIPFFHMGRQYQGVPPDWAIQAAHDCIDAGATAVISSHPHTIQGMELYNGKPIVYGLGNFIYDQMFSVETRTGEVLALTFKGNQLIGLRVHGIEIEDFTQPRLMGTGEQAAFMTRFWRSTDRIAGKA
ncbi:MAG: CapA family protein [Chloroflexia bacterium]|nr:CapA family protein [Chloroflexia bacterium]